MSKLLPLEYCRLDRAARLLGCEVEDLIHWGAIKAVDLCLQIQGSKCEIIDNRDKDRQISEPFVGGKIYKLNNGLAHYWVTKEDQENPYRGAMAALGISDDHECYDDYIDDNDPNFRTETICSGFWSVPYGIPLDIENSLDGKHELYGSYTVSCVDEGKKIFAAVFFSVEGKFITASDLRITRQNMEKLHQAIKGNEPLLNIYNNAEIADQAKEQQLQNNKPQIRETVKQFDMIKALILTNSGLESLVDNASGLLSELEKLCAKKGIKTPVSDAKTIRDWLNRANIRKVQ